MINYTRMTVSRAIDKIILKIGRHNMPENLGASDMFYFINRSIREIISLTLAYKDYSYIRRLEAGHGDIMPPEYIDRVRLLLGEDGVEARYVSVREFFNLSTGTPGSAWQTSYTEAPVYTVWGNGKPQRLTLFTSPEIATGVFEVYAMPQWVTAYADVLPIPSEYENYVILATVTRVLFKTTQRSNMKVIEELLKIERRKLIDRYLEKDRTTKRNLDSFIEPAIPNIPPQPEEGEVPKDL